MTDEEIWQRIQKGLAETLSQYSAWSVSNQHWLKNRNILDGHINKVNAVEIVKAFLKEDTK